MSVEFSFAVSGRRVPNAYRVVLLVGNYVAVGEDSDRACRAQVTGGYYSFAVSGVGVPSAHGYDSASR